MLQVMEQQLDNSSTHVTDYALVEETASSCVEEDMTSTAGSEADMSASSCTAESPTMTTNNTLAKHQKSSSNDGVFFLGSSLFSVYEEMGKQMKSEGWRVERSLARLARCDVVLGDRFEIPYHTLHTLPRRPPRRNSAMDNNEDRVWVNYFRGSHKITLKAPMAQLLSPHDGATSRYPWMPETYVLCSDTSKRGVRDEQHRLELAAATDPHAIWIVKPSSGCKGAGVMISKDAQEIKAFVGASKTIYVAQKYVAKPLLVVGRRKFDIRVWALLVDPYSVYVFSQASCRTASVPYATDTFNDTLVHLTNHCLQEGAAAYGQYEEGNEIMLSEIHNSVMIESELAQQRVTSSCSSVQQVLWPQIVSIVHESLLCAKEHIEVDRGEPFRCFQLFGYDFISDEDLNVHLLEINGSPGVAQRLLPGLVAGVRRVLNLTTSSSSTMEIDACAETATITTDDAVAAQTQTTRSDPSLEPAMKYVASSNGEWIRTLH